MVNINCWEFKKCGREVSGINAKNLGVCPAATFVNADGFCGGENGGRACVYISGTFCCGSVDGSFQDKVRNCVKCDYFKILKKEYPFEFGVLQFHKYVNESVNPKELAVAV